MHMCCANCSLYPLQSLSLKGMQVKGLWFNPNIQPDDEYQRRLDTLQTLERMEGLDIEYIEGTGKEGFPPLTPDNPPDNTLDNPEDNTGGRRCAACYALRLDRTAQTAKAMGLDGFTTSLLVSPYQRFPLIVEAAREAGKRHGVLFYFEDFRPGWPEGRQMSKQLGLYRQNYCGCLHSKVQRERDKEARRAARTAAKAGALKQ